MYKNVETWEPFAFLLLIIIIIRRRNRLCLTLTPRKQYLRQRRIRREKRTSTWKTKYSKFGCDGASFVHFIWMHRLRASSISMSSGTINPQQQYLLHDLAISRHTHQMEFAIRFYDSVGSLASTFRRTAWLYTFADDTETLSCAFLSLNEWLATYTTGQNGMWNDRKNGEIFMH